MATRKRIVNSEREMHAHWVACAGRLIRTQDGEEIRVLYPGIPAGNSGPDYTDAVVAFAGDRIVRGDVELHLYGEDWRRHGHHSDPAYNGVVLHVVADPHCTVRTRSVCGNDVAVVVLDVEGCRTGGARLPCTAMAREDPESVQRISTRAGIAWLLSRSAGIAADAAGPEPWKLLIHRSARALGYSANAGAAMELGRRLTGAGVLPLLMGGPQELRAALVVGLAGLLPSQRRAAGMSVTGLAPEWEALWRKFDPGVPAMAPGLWKLSGLYPNNSPVRRMVALASLLPRMEELADRATEIVTRSSEDPRRSAACLERHYRVGGDDYWRHHFDFGLRTRESDLVGVSKAREMVVNALLPCLCAESLLSGSAERLTSAVRLLSAYPPAPAHAITRHMQKQLALTRGCGSAGMQQGLLHIFRGFCRCGLCSVCPFVVRDPRSVLCVALESGVAPEMVAI